MNRTDLKDYLTDEERNKLVASLHHALVWVGVKEPEELLVDKSQLKQEMEKFHRTGQLICQQKSIAAREG